MVCILQEQMTVEMVSALVALSNLMLQKVVLPRLACVVSCKCNEQHVFFSCGSSCFQKLWLYRQERKINSLAYFRNFHVLPLLLLLLTNTITTATTTIHLYCYCYCFFSSY